jgi:hypothetical protein
MKYEIKSLSEKITADLVYNIYDCCHLILNSYFITINGNYSHFTDIAKSFCVNAYEKPWIVVILVVLTTFDRASFFEVAGVVKTKLPFEFSSKISLLKFVKPGPD